MKPAKLCQTHTGSVGSEQEGVLAAMGQRMEVFKNDQRGKTRLTCYWKDLLTAASFCSCLLRACPPLTCCVQHKFRTTPPCSCPHTDHAYGMDPIRTVFKSAANSCPPDRQQACDDLTRSFPSYAFGMQGFDKHSGHRNLPRHHLTPERKIPQRHDQS